jgi:hypothetical protein
VQEFACFPYLRAHIPEKMMEQCNSGFATLFGSYCHANNLGGGGGCDFHFLALDKAEDFIPQKVSLFNFCCRDFKEN